MTAIRPKGHFRLYGYLAETRSTNAAPDITPGVLSPVCSASTSFADLSTASNSNGSSYISMASMPSWDAVADARHEAIADKDSAPGHGEELQSKVMELQSKLAAAMEIIGERDEAIEALRHDLEESRRIYREQLEVMAARLAKYESQHKKVLWLGAAAACPPPPLLSAAASEGGAAAATGPVGGVPYMVTAVEVTALHEETIGADVDSAGDQAGAAAATAAVTPKSAQRASSASVPDATSAAEGEAGLVFAAAEVPVVDAADFVAAPDANAVDAQEGAADARTLAAARSTAPPLWAYWAPCIKPRRPQIWAGSV